MLEYLNKLFTETVKLSQEIWLIILLAVVGAVFLITLIVGLVAGEFNKTKSLMKRAAANPAKAVAFMKQMPPVVKKEYKRARMAGVEPSAFVTEADCVDRPFARSLVSKIWLVTLIATVVCAMIGFFVAPLAAQSAIAAENARIAAEIEAGAEGVESTLDERLLANAMYILPLLIFACGGILTLIGGIVGLGAHSGAHGVYSKFAVAIDGGAQVEQPIEQPVQSAQDGIAFESRDDGAQAYADQPVYAEEQQPMYAEPQQEYVQPQAYSEPQQEQVYATPVQDMQSRNEEEMRRAREEAIARARAEQEAQIAAQQAAARQAAAQATAQQQFAAQQAARQQQQQPQPQPQPVVQNAGPSSADEVIARIEQIDREGAPRETMREVASLLQKERQKPENKTPEQQKKLNEALSKLLKAMSAASRK